MAKTQTGVTNGKIVFEITKFPAFNKRIVKINYKKRGKSG